MRRGMAGAGSSDRAPIAVTQGGEADVKAAMRAPGSRDRSNPHECADQKCPVDALGMARIL